MKKVFVLIFLAGILRASDLETISPTPVGNWDFSAGTVIVSTPTAAGQVANKGFVEAEMAGGGDGVAEVNHRISLYGGVAMSDIYNSSDSVNTYGGFWEVCVATGSISEWYIKVASMTTSAFTVRAWLNGVSTGTISVGSGVPYVKNTALYISVGEADVIGIDFENVVASDPPGGVNVIAVLKEN